MEWIEWIQIGGISYQTRPLVARKWFLDSLKCPWCSFDSLAPLYYLRSQIWISEDE